MQKRFFFSCFFFPPVDVFLMPFFCLSSAGSRSGGLYSDDDIDDIETDVVVILFFCFFFIPLFLFCLSITLSILLSGKGKGENCLIRKASIFFKGIAFDILQ